MLLIIHDQCWSLHHIMNPKFYVLALEIYPPVCSAHWHCLPKPSPFLSQLIKNIWTSSSSYYFYYYCCARLFLLIIFCLSKGFKPPLPPLLPPNVHRNQPRNHPDKVDIRFKNPMDQDIRDKIIEKLHKLYKFTDQHCTAAQACLPCLLHPCTCYVFVFGYTLCTTQDNTS